MLGDSDQQLQGSSKFIVNNGINDIQGSIHPTLMVMNKVSHIMYNGHWCNYNGINLQGGGQPTPTGMYRNMKISTPKGMQNFQC